MLSGIKPRELAARMQMGTRGYAQELYYYLGRDLMPKE